LISKRIRFDAIGKPNLQNLCALAQSGKGEAWRKALSALHIQPMPTRAPAG
jgi:hypothetical protein